MSTALLKLDLKKPHQSYHAKDGSKLPGVTTILGSLAKPELIPWAAWEERVGILRTMGLDSSWSSEKLSATLPKNADGTPLYFCNAKRDKAADIGTITHERVRAFHHGTDVDPEGLDPDLYAQSAFGLERFKTWWAGQNMQADRVEFEMVSEAQRCGGTGDLFTIRRDGTTAYLDLKTTKANKRWPFKDTLAQSAQYAKMYREVTGAPVDEVIIYRVGKEAGDPGQVYTMNEYQRKYGEALFEAARQVYEASYALGK